MKAIILSGSSLSLPKTNNMKRTLLLSLCLFGSIGRLFCQDLHQTDYRLNPMLLNPAYTGAYWGSLRVGGVYRDQFRPFIVQAWKSPAFYVDSPVSKGFKQNDWVGVGLHVFTDRAGVAGLSSSGAYLTAAYHLGLDKRNFRLLSFGVQYGSINRRVDDASGIIFADELQNITPLSPDQNYFDQYKHNYSDLNIGVKYVARTSKTNTLLLGANARHLLRPAALSDFLNLVVTLHATYRYRYSKRVDFEPVVYFNTTKTATTVSAQWMAHYRLLNAQKTALRLGLGYRSKDAMQVMVGALQDGWEFGLAFDLTVSAAASATRGFGGFELGASKIIKIYKKPEAPPSILCPRL